MLYTSAFPNGFCFRLSKLAWTMLLPSYWIFSRAVALISPTTTEAKDRRCLRLVIGLPCCAVLLLLTAPLVLVGAPIWWTMQLCQRRYIYSYIPIPDAPSSAVVSGSNSKRYTIATANLCLLHDPFARFNNLKDSRKRAAEIGRRIVASQRPSSLSDGASGLYQASAVPASESGHILAHFPSDVDIFCFQEVFDREAMRLLKDQLQKVCPYVVYDVGVNSWQSNRYLLNSGLLLASRYPPLAIGFKSYAFKCGVDNLASKGLLMVKLDLDSAEANVIDKAASPSTRRRRVGYVFNTHLQAQQAPGSKVRACQLSCVREWTAEFRNNTLRPNEEVLAFDVFCGDLNVDTISADDAGDRGHACLTVDYCDPCCVRDSPKPIEHDWVIGTSLRNAKLHDPEIATPEKLQAILADADLRATYIGAAKKEDGSLVPGGRRLDYVMFARQSLEERWTVVDNVHFVAELAGQTDHLPVAVSFRCCGTSDNEQ